jgi:hypothetical protein
MPAAYGEPLDLAGRFPDSARLTCVWPRQRSRGFPSQQTAKRRPELTRYPELAALARLNEGPIRTASSAPPKIAVDLILGAFCCSMDDLNPSRSGAHTGGRGNE